MWVRSVLAAVAGLSAGFAAAGGLFAFIVELGVTSKFADRTHTADQIHRYEMSVALGGILGNLLFLFPVRIPGGAPALAVFGLFSGIFVGCWAMALAEVLNLFPVFLRKARTFRAIPWIILGLAAGKGIGALLYYYLELSAG